MQPNFKIPLYFIGVLLIYLLFPTQNSTIDAYCYAADIRWQNNLFQPHHLLYNATGWLLYKLFTFTGISVLAFMKSLNALVCTGSLFFLYKTLLLLNTQKKTAILATTFVAFSFGVWRYTGENEVYLFPILFSILATFYFAKYIFTQKKFFLISSGFLAALACLFHQIHFFWWLAIFATLFFTLKNKKYIILFLFPSLIVPLAYLLVIINSENNTVNLQTILHFVFRDYFSETTNTNFSLKHILLSLINFFRTHLQVHGIIPFLLKKQTLFYIPAIVSIILASLALYNFFLGRSSASSKSANTQQTSPEKLASLLQVPNSARFEKNFSLVQKTCITAFCLQFAFAIFSVGNAEFMVMLPFLLVMIFIKQFEIHHKPITYLIAAMFFWNLFFGILPNRLYNFYNNEQLCNKITTQKNAVYILFDKALIINILYYKTGKEFWLNLHNPPIFTTDKNTNFSEVDSFINNSLQKNIAVFTDCVEKPQLFNRASIVGNAAKPDFFNKFNLRLVDSISGYYGQSKIYEVRSNLLIF